MLGVRCASKEKALNEWLSTLADTMLCRAQCTQRLVKDSARNVRVELTKTIPLRNFKGSPISHLSLQEETMLKSTKPAE